MSAIRELLVLATMEGESKATLETEADARLFRFAVYSFRKAQDFGHDLSVTIEGNCVIVRKRQTPIVEISSPSQQGAL